VHFGGQRRSSPTSSQHRRPARTTASIRALAGRPQAPDARFWRTAGRTQPAGSSPAPGVAGVSRGSAPRGCSCPIGVASCPCRRAGIVSASRRSGSIDALGHAGQASDTRERGAFRLPAELPRETSPPSLCRMHDATGSAPAFNIRGRMHRGRRPYSLRDCEKRADTLSATPAISTAHKRGRRGCLGPLCGGGWFVRRAAGIEPRAFDCHAPGRGVSILSGAGGISDGQSG
jgi:hypothetical protein